jgi:hypothetical protein
LKNRQKNFKIVDRKTIWKVREINSGSLEAKIMGG